jgi:hypothetical protein
MGLLLQLFIVFFFIVLTVLFILGRKRSCIGFLCAVLNIIPYGILIASLCFSSYINNAKYFRK